MKIDRSSKITIVYCLFTILYCLYIAGHSGDFGSDKGDGLWYSIKFLLISNYLFFILQGAILRSGNWGVLLLLPPAILLATVILLFLFIAIIRLGGGNLLDKDNADMILMALVLLTLSWWALRWIRPGSKRKKNRRR